MVGDCWTGGAGAAVGTIDYCPVSLAVGAAPDGPVSSRVGWASGSGYSGTGPTRSVSNKMVWVDRVSVTCSGTPKPDHCTSDRVRVLKSHPINLIGYPIREREKVGGGFMTNPSVEHTQTQYTALKFLRNPLLPTTTKSRSLHPLPPPTTPKVVAADPLCSSHESALSISDLFDAQGQGIHMVQNQVSDDHVDNLDFEHGCDVDKDMGMSGDEDEIPLDSKKRKKRVVTSRSPWWDHFHKFYCEKDKVQNARCKYCSREIKADPKVHGTRPLKNHFESCKNKPHEVSTNQARLSFQSIRLGEREAPLVNWRFDQERIREALSYMLVVDELPSKMVENPGFRHFMFVAYLMKTDLSKKPYDGVPIESDWNRAKLLLKFLKYFYNLTLCIFGSSYVISNIVFHEICEVDLLLKRWLNSEDLN
ncbi:UNVERIFIED_CONTAM: hypothetical protein Scaly_2252900 [Sesamum calycinum]|uniref:BED-type domain-containing protein n=1 Tax=Sesamum calycinum TaxID=2727403 RepID=A0AAW2MB53_9LAMI